MHNNQERLSNGYVRQRSEADTHPDLTLIRTSVMLPRWLKRWSTRQPESLGAIITEAVQGYCGAEPPAQVMREVAKASNETTQEELDAIEERAKKAAKSTPLRWG